MFLSSPYIICALLNRIIPSDVQGDAAVTKIVNLAGNIQWCSGISRIKLTKSVSWRNRTSVANVSWNDVLPSLVYWPLADAWPDIRTFQLLDHGFSVTMIGQILLGTEILQRWILPLSNVNDWTQLPKLRN